MPVLPVTRVIARAAVALSFRRKRPEAGRWTERKRFLPDGAPVRDSPGPRSSLWISGPPTAADEAGTWSSLRAGGRSRALWTGLNLEAGTLFVRKSQGPGPSEGP